jgi:hypothetical protein
MILSQIEWPFFKYSNLASALWFGFEFYVFSSLIFLTSYKRLISQVPKNAPAV